MKSIRFILIDTALSQCSLVFMPLWILLEWWLLRQYRKGGRDCILMTLLSYISNLILSRDPRDFFAGLTLRAVLVMVTWPAPTSWVQVPCERWVCLLPKNRQESRDTNPAVSKKWVLLIGWVRRKQIHSRWATRGDLKLICQLWDKT